MIEFKKGNILKDNSDAIINTVNCVGVMGKGLALQFKNNFPENFQLYKAACDKGLVKTGKMFITQIPNPEPLPLATTKWIINFPTKNHWRNDSELEYVDQGLIDLTAQIKALGLKSIAIPPLGAGLGGLNWDIVKEKIIQALSCLSDVKVSVYEPFQNTQPQEHAQVNPSSSNSNPAPSNAQPKAVPN